MPPFSFSTHPRPESPRGEFGHMGHGGQQFDLDASLFDQQLEQQYLFDLGVGQSGLSSTAPIPIPWHSTNSQSGGHATSANSQPKNVYLENGDMTSPIWDPLNLSDVPEHIFIARTFQETGQPATQTCNAFLPLTTDYQSRDAMTSQMFNFIDSSSTAVAPPPAFGAEYPQSLPSFDAAEPLQQSISRPMEPLASTQPAIGNLHSRDWARGFGSYRHTLPGRANPEDIFSVIEGARPIPIKPSRNSPRAIRSPPRPRSTISSGTRRGRPLGSNLTLQQKDKANHVRGLGACIRCHDKKLSCDGGSPCQHCQKSPNDPKYPACQRTRTIEELITFIVSGAGLDWRPRERSIAQITGSDAYQLSETIVPIPIIFGVGPDSIVEVKVIRPSDTSRLWHHHVTSTSPLTEVDAKAPLTDRYQIVLPAVASDPESLKQALSKHVTLLVADRESFELIKFHDTTRKILGPILRLARGLDETHPHYNMLHKSLRLLVLISISGSVRLEQYQGNWDPQVKLILQTILPPDMQAEVFGNAGRAAGVVTPCYIRSQTSVALKELAEDLGRDIARGLALLVQDNDSPHIGATFAVVSLIIIAFETAQSHHERPAYHKMTFEETVSTSVKATRVKTSGIAASRLILWFNKNFGHELRCNMSDPNSPQTTKARRRRGTSISSVNSQRSTDTSGPFTFASIDTAPSSYTNPSLFPLSERDLWLNNNFPDDLTTPPSFSMFTDSPSQFAFPSLSSSQTTPTVSGSPLLRAISPRHNTIESDFFHELRERFPKIDSKAKAKQWQNSASSLAQSGLSFNSLAGGSGGIDQIAGEMEGQVPMAGVKSPTPRPSFLTQLLEKANTSR